MVLRVLLLAGSIGLAHVSALTGCGDQSPAEKVVDKAFYVAPDGSDGNSGTKRAPFRTIAKGLSVLRSGTTTYVRTGVYRENVTLHAPNCAVQAPCVLRNAPGDRPVLQGLLRLQGGSAWSVDGLGVTWDPRAEPDEHMVKVDGGSHWTLRRMELSGARSYANLLVVGEPRAWRVTQNCIRDTYPSNDVNQDHNVYVNTGDGGRDGLIDRNLLFNAPNGSNLKLGGPDASDSTTSNIIVSHNTMFNAAQNLLVSGGSHDIRIDRNITAQASLRAYRAYQLTGDRVVLAAGLSAGAPEIQYADPGFRSLALDRVETVEDPQFDRLACGGFRPGDKTAQAYGAYAP